VRGIHQVSLAGFPVWLSKHPCFANTNLAGALSIPEFIPRPAQPPMKTESPSAMTGYMCQSCEQSFTHFRGTLMPCCPRCGHNRHVRQAPPQWIYALLLSLLALVIAAATGLAFR
jgi:DNA-directed RNA polymerase subunit RPC12/RpoP